jgi:hypothetical protein
MVLVEGKSLGLDHLVEDWELTLNFKPILSSDEGYLTAFLMRSVNDLRSSAI